MTPDRMKNVLRTSIAAALSLLTVSVAYSHDIWLHADKFRLERGDLLIVRQLLGEELDTDLSRPESTQELPILMDMTPRFSLIGPQGTVDLLAELPDIRTQPTIVPVLQRKLDFNGLALVTMEHAPLYTEFTSSEFLEYLHHEELDPERFRQHMGSRESQSKAYIRTLKCLVQVGDTTGSAPATELHKQVLGQRIEIVLQQNPYGLDPGDKLDAQVLLDSEPLPDQLVKAYNSNRDGSVSLQRARTNAAGIARISLDRAGLWLLRSVYMAPCSGRPEMDCEDTDWESAWTAYSFELD